MKQKILALFLMGAMTTWLCGCGSTENISYSNVASIVQSQSNDPDIVHDNGANCGDESYIANDGYVSSPEEDAVPQDSSEPELPSSVDLSNVDGIIVAMFDRQSIGREVSRDLFDIGRLDPESGELELLTSFHIDYPTSTSTVSEYYVASGLVQNNLNGYDRRFFSSDYTKMAVTKVFNERGGETHAGWVDQQGNFFDVTEALGKASSGFDDPVHYGAVGFTEDGYFVYTSNYKEFLDMRKEVNFYYTKIDNLEEHEGNPLANTIMCYGGTLWYSVSDWIDETHCLVSKPLYQGSYIYDTTTGALTGYIPGESRLNWSGVISPDGTTVAFLSVYSQHYSIARDAEVYTILFGDDGKPQQLSGHLTLDDSMTNKAMWSLLEWR